MRWRRKPPVVKRLEGDYAEGVRRSRKAMKPYEARLLRSKTLAQVRHHHQATGQRQVNFPLPLA